MAAETIVRLPSDSSNMTVDEVFASLAPKPPRGGVIGGAGLLLAAIVAVSDPDGASGGACAAMSAANKPVVQAWPPTSHFTLPP